MCITKKIHHNICTFYYINKVGNIHVFEVFGNKLNIKIFIYEKKYYNKIIFHSVK